MNKYTDTTFIVLVHDYMIQSNSNYHITNLNRIINHYVYRLLKSNNPIIKLNLKVCNITSSENVTIPILFKFNSLISVPLMNKLDKSAGRNYTILDETLNVLYSTHLYGLIPSRTLH